MKKHILLSVFVAFFCSTSAYAQNTQENGSINQAFQLKGTHSISFHAGYQDFESQLAYTSGKITATPHFMGFMSYQYWTENNSALSFSAGILKSEAHVRFSSTFSKITLPVVIGYNFYPNGLNWGKVGRGYFGMTIGTYIETSSGVSLDFDNFVSGTKTKANFGADLHIGLDFFSI